MKKLVEKKKKIV